MGEIKVKKCGKIAVSLIVWLDGRKIKMCMEHEAQARGLCAAMGLPLTIIVLVSKEETCESKVVE